MASPAPLTPKLLRGESEADFQALARDYRDRFRPKGAAEEELVDALIQTSWNLRRYEALHSEVLATLMAEEEGRTLAEAFLADCRGPKAIDKLFRYARDLRRVHDRTLKQLLEIQQLRPAEPIEKKIDETKPIAVSKPSCASPSQHYSSPLPDAPRASSSIVHRR